MSAANRDSFTFTATGDAIVTEPFPEYNGNTDAFDRVRTLLQNADTAITQLEVPIPSPDDPIAVPPAVPDQYQYLAAYPGSAMAAPPSILDELAGMGLDVFTAASNHAADYGRNGIESTITALEARNLPFAGIGTDLGSARAPGSHQTPASRVAVVNATTAVGPGTEATPASADRRGAPGVNPLHLRWQYRSPREAIDTLRDIAEATGIERVKGTWLRRDNPGWVTDPGYYFMHMRFLQGESSAIETEPYEPDERAILDTIDVASSSADWTIATLHVHQGPAGSRNVPEIPGFLQTFARDCVDAGADAFVGTGPHVLRGIELYDGCPLFYSLGNFIYQIERASETPPNYREPGTAPTENDPSVPHSDGRRWETIIPRATFHADGTLNQVDLFPCTLGRDREPPRRGVPHRATEGPATTILDRVADLSNPLGTTIDREGDIGIIRGN